MTLGSQKFWEIPPKNDVLNVHGIRSPTDPGHVWCLMPGSQWPFLKRYLSKHQNLPCIHLSHVRIVYEFMKSCILMFKVFVLCVQCHLSSVWCSKTSKQQQQQQNEYGQIFTGLYVPCLCNRLTASSQVCYTTQIDIGTTIQFTNIGFYVTTIKRSQFACFYFPMVNETLRLKPETWSVDKFFLHNYFCIKPCKNETTNSIEK